LVANSNFLQVEDSISIHIQGDILWNFLNHRRQNKQLSPALLYTSSSSSRRRKNKKKKKKKKRKLDPDKTDSQPKLSSSDSPTTATTTTKEDEKKLDQLLFPLQNAITSTSKRFIKSSSSSSP
jgi:hypothetical protein